VTANDARCAHEMKCRTVMAKATINKMMNLFTSKLTYIKRVVKCYNWSIVFMAETWTLQEVDKKYLECVEMWCWRIQPIT
jgi:hypothetical protein